MRWEKRTDVDRIPLIFVEDGTMTCAWAMRGFWWLRFLAMSDLDYRRLVGIISYTIIDGMKYINNDICGVKKIEYFNRRNDLGAVHIWSKKLSRTSLNVCESL